LPFNIKFTDMKYIKLYSFLFLAAFLFNSCRNPAYELDVLFDANIITYKATIILKDATGAVLPNDLNVTVSGPDAAAIYDFSGTKKIYAPGGVITVGVTPKMIPTASKTLNFNVLISGPGYDDKNIPVTIDVTQFNQIINVTMLKVSAPTAVTSVANTTAALNASGTTTTATTLSTPGTGTVAERTTVSIPAGVQMRNAAGTALTGSTVTVNVVNYEAKDPATNDLFPGGGLTAPNVVLEGGATGSAFFVPAGFTSVKMFVDGQPVKNFSNPISVNVEVDPTFVPAGSTVPVKAGDILKVYSYDVATGQFKFEQPGTVALNSFGKLAVTFTTTHLTTFVVGDAYATTACVDTKVTFVAPWLNEGSQPMNIEILNAAGTKVLATSISVVQNGSTDVWRGLPSVALTYRVKNNTGELLASGSIATPCAGTALNITLATPVTPPSPNVTMDLTVICPGKGTIIVPNFDLFYKPAGAPNTEYQLLGTVEKGRLVTNLVKVGTAYDFRAGWRNEVKVISNRTITAQDQSVVVGEDNFLGNTPASQANNRALLIEACKTQ
jgi:hypothetical protein